MKDQIEKFVTECQKLIDKHAVEQQMMLSKSTLSIEWGKKYAKIVASSLSQKSVYCFVDLSTGDVFKAASWSRPAKHVRGNIEGDVSSFMTPYGAAYLK